MSAARRRSRDVDIAHHRQRLLRPRHGDPPASRQGIDDFVVLERGDDVGGTWRDNTYPGCALRRARRTCTRSRSRRTRTGAQTYSPQPEIRAYLQRCADELRRPRRTSASSTTVERRRRGTRTRSAGRIETDRGDAARARARRRHGPADRAAASRTSPGSTRSRARSSTPRAGTTTTTSTGKRVAVDRHRRLGDPVRARDPARGRAAARLPAHAAVDHAAHRTARSRGCEQRALPARSRRCRGSCARAHLRGPRAARARLRQATRGSCSSPSAIARAPHAQRRSPTPSCARRSRPTTRSAASGSCSPTTGTRRSRKPNVELRHRAAIAEVRAQRRSSPRTATSTRSTRSSSAPASRSPTCRSASCVRGRDGPHARRRLGRQPAARYRGTTVAGFPNLFLLLGPNTGLGPHLDGLHDRVADRTTCSTRCARCDARGAATVEVAAARRRTRYNARARRAASRARCGTRGCASWYLDDTGRNATLWPDWTFRFRRRSAQLRPGRVRLRAARPPSARRCRHERARPDHRRGERHRRGRGGRAARAAARGSSGSTSRDGDDIIACDVRDQAAVDARGRRGDRAPRRPRRADQQRGHRHPAERRRARPTTDALAVLDVNLIGPWRVTAAALPALRESRGPRGQRRLRPRATSPSRSRPRTA